jgi:hypothetical protein
MYFEEKDVRRLIVAMVERFPGIEIMFDAIPCWFAKKTLRGFGKTKSYTAPPMPWGVNRDDVEPLIRAWSHQVSSVTVEPYGILRAPRWLYWIFSRVPVLRNFPPTIVRVRAALDDEPSKVVAP